MASYLLPAGRFTRRRGRRATPLEEWTRGREIRNQQYTATARFKKDLSPTWNLELLQSYDLWAFKDAAGCARARGRRARRTNSKRSAARLRFGLPTTPIRWRLGWSIPTMWFHDPPYSDALDLAPAVSNRNWQTDTVSLLAEHQWKINRPVDDVLEFPHGQTHLLGLVVVAARHGGVHADGAGHVQSHGRTNRCVAAGMKSCGRNGSASRTIPDPETLRSYEISYERKLTDHWRVGGNAFFEDYDAIGWSSTLYHSSSIGNFQIAGGELLLTYSNRTTRLTLSEGVAKLVDATLPKSLPAAGQGITAEPYGFGHDLAEWAPFITKLASLHDVGKKWTVSSSLVYYSGFPGAEDYAKYNATLAKPLSAVPLQRSGIYGTVWPELVREPRLGVSPV